MNKFADWFDDAFSNLSRRHPKLGDFLFGMLILASWVFCVLFYWWFQYLFRPTKHTGSLLEVEKKVESYSKYVDMAFKTARRHLEPNTIVTYTARQHPFFAITIHSLKSKDFYIRVINDRVVLRMKKRGN